MDKSNWLQDSLDYEELRAQTNDVRIRGMWQTLKKPRAAPGKNALLPNRRRTTQAATIARKSVYREIWHELYLVICTNDAKYSKYRSKFVAAGGKGTPAIVAVVTGAVATEYGTTYAVVVPYVAAGLACLLKAGKEAVCRRFSPFDSGHPATKVAKKKKKS